MTSFHHRRSRCGKPSEKAGEEFYGRVVWKVPKFKFGTSLKLLDVIRDLDVNWLLRGC